MSGVPMVDKVDLSLLRDKDVCTVDGEKGTVELPNVKESKVVSCVLVDGDELLILKRSDKVGTFKGCWAVVSGFVEEGEVPVQTAIREMTEEIGKRPSDPIRAGEVVHVRDGPRMWSVHPFLFKASDRNITIDWEHTEYKWISLSDLGKYQTVPGLDRVLMNLGQKVGS